jgi:predicted PurR-regulated permease PerM
MAGQLRPEARKPNGAGTPDAAPPLLRDGSAPDDGSGERRRYSSLAGAEEAGAEIAEDFTRPLDPFQPPKPDRRGITVHISGRTIALVFTVLIVLYLLETLSTVIIMFAGAVLLAAAVDLPASWLERHRVPRSIGVLVIYLLVFGALAAVVYELTPLVTSEIQDLSKNLPKYTKQIEDFINRQSQNAGGGQQNGTNISLSNAADKVSGSLGEIATRLTSFTFTFGRDAIRILAMFVAAYFFAMDPQIGTRFLRRFLSPPTQERMHSITGNIHRRIGGWVQGQVMIAVTFGVLFGVGLWIIRVPHAFALGLAAVVLEVVPYLGGVVVLVLGVLVALGVGVPQVIGVIILYTILVNVESHVLAPTFYGRAVGMPPVAILAALVSGLELRGIAGVFLAVPASLVIYAIIDEFWPSPEELNPDGTPKKKESPPGWFKRAVTSIANRIRSA